MINEWTIKYVMQKKEMSKKKKEESKLPTVENTKQKLKIIIKQKIKNIIHVVRKLLQK